MNKITAINRENSFSGNGITRRFAMQQILENRYLTRINVGNGITSEMLSEAARCVMEHKGADYYDMSGEELAAAINTITSCCYKMCA